MRATILVCALVACLAPNAHGDVVNVIYQHNPYYEDPNNPGWPFYGVFPSAEVRIYSGVAGQTFEFEATLEENGQYLSPGDIRAITADPNAGPVTISVVGHNGHAYGAQDIGAIDLFDKTGVVGTIEDIVVRGNLATLGPVAATALAGMIDLDDPNNAQEIQNDVHFTFVDGGILCDGMRSLQVDEDSPDGNIQINGCWGGDGRDTLETKALGSLYVGGPVSGDITLAGDVGGIDFENSGCDIAAGVTVYVDGNVGSLDFRTLLGTIEITGDLNGCVGDFPALGGLLHIHGDLSSKVDVKGAGLTGTLRVDGDVYYDVGVRSYYSPMSGLIQIGDNPAGPPGNCYGNIEVGYWSNEPPREYCATDLTGAIRIAGSMYGDIDIVGNLGDPNDPNTPLRGYIAIDGGFGPDPNDPNATAPTIRITEEIVSDGSFVCVDYDGSDDPLDTWTGNALVIEHADPSDPNGPHTPEYVTPNESAYHVYRVTPCKGDMNNDGLTDFRDINPFVTALSNPEAYATSLYPGLGALAAPWDVGGSRVYHGDINGDGLFNFGDINPFVALLSDPNNPCAAAQEGGGAGGGEMMMMELPEDGGEANATPEGMAAGLANVVPPEGYADLLGLVSFAIQNAPDEAQSAYWLAVYGALTE